MYQETAEEHALMVAVMTAAADLVQTHNSALSSSAIRTRMLRIADDLVIATENRGD